MGLGSGSRKFRLGGSAMSRSWFRYVKITGNAGDVSDFVSGEGRGVLLGLLEPSRASTPHVTDCGDRSLHQAVKRDLHEIMNAENRVAARHAASRFARRWREPYPKAVACRRHDLDDLLSAFRFAAPERRRRPGPPTPSSGASARSADEQDPWASSPSEPQSSASSSPFSPVRTATRESASLSC